MTHHPDWQALNALADGITPAGDVRAHVAQCDACQHTVAALTSLAHAAHRLPSTLPVPQTDDLWREIASRIAPQSAPSRVTNASTSRQMTWRVLATAAAIAIVSSGTTWWVMRAPGSSDVTASSVMPVAFQRTEATYLDNVAQLRGDLERLRALLDPRTVAAVERSLDVIDAAIAEARGALLADPANAAVSELLASHYRQKIELLRRATQLTPAA